MPLASTNRWSLLATYISTVRILPISCTDTCTNRSSVSESSTARLVLVSPIGTYTSIPVFYTYFSTRCYLVDISYTLVSAHANMNLYTGCTPLSNTLVTRAGAVCPYRSAPRTISPTCIWPIGLILPSAIRTGVPGCKQDTPACVAFSINVLDALSATY